MDVVVVDVAVLEVVLEGFCLGANGDRFSWSLIIAPPRNQLTTDAGNLLLTSPAIKAVSSFLTVDVAIVPVVTFRTTASSWSLVLFSINPIPALKRVFIAAEICVNAFPRAASSFLMVSGSAWCV